jgi:hypothetical protein
MTDPFYQKFVKRWQEVTDLPPQDVGPFTPVYKSITSRLKVMPWQALAALSILLVIVLYLIFGPSITKLVSLLQRGF